MNTLIKLSILVLMSFCFSKLALACGGKVKEWTLSEGLSNPESAILDPRTGHIFVSNVAGSPKEKDGKGFISRVNQQGTMLNSEWHHGLHAPKGMAIIEKSLWVADIDRLVAIDIDTGNLIKAIEVKGSRFLNDVTSGSDGSLYISDTEASRIYILKPGASEAEIFVEGPQWESPNGLWVDNSKLYVAAWGYVEDISKSPAKKGSLFQIDLLTKEKKLISKQGLGNLDGIIPSNQKGVFFFSDWVSGTVNVISLRGWIGNVKGFNKLKGRKVQGTADLGFTGDLLLIPSMVENKLYAVNANYF